MHYSRIGFSLIPKISLVFVFFLLQLASPAATANVVTDPSFEAGTANWTLDDNTISITASPTRTGTKALKLISVGNGVDSPAHNASQNRITGIVPGQEYIYSVWVSGSGLAGVGTGGKPLAIVRWRDSANNIIRTYDNKWKESFQWAPYGTYAYQEMKMALQAPANAAKADVIFRTWWGTTAGESYWDDVSLSPRDFSARGTLSATYQAETANLKSGGGVLAEHLDYTGTGYYDVTTDGAILEWNNVAGGGDRVLSVRYSWEGNLQDFEIFVNGVSQGVQKPLPTGRRGIWASDLWNVTLPAGNNTIRLKIGKKGGLKSQPMIDKLEVYDPSVAANQPPILTTIGPQTVNESELLTVPLVAGDADGPAPLTLSETNNLPGNPSILSDFGDGIGELSWTPAVGDAVGGPYQITVTATDGSGASNSETITVNVQAGALPPSGGTLSGTPATAPASVDLTSEGSTDWVHWGHITATDVDRKSGVAAQISDFTPIGSGSPWRATSMPTTYAWTDGTPTGAAAGSQSGVGIFHAGKGVEFTVPADTTAKTLRVYMGTVNGATGRLEASLSDGSAPAYSTELYQASGASTRVVTLNFQAASAGQTLTVRYVVDRKDDPTVGSITLDSATLQAGGGGGGGNQAPVLAAIGAQTVTEGQPLTVNVSASDADGPTPLLLTATNVPTGANFTDLGNGNGQLTWTPVVGDATGSPYSVTITATEDGGAGLSDSETVSITVNPVGGGSIYSQQVSVTPNRANPVALAGATVQGLIYVFVGPTTDVQRVRFFIDGVLRRTENLAPFDLTGGSGSAANPFDTTTLSDGNHTFTAEVTKISGGTDTLVATVNVANSGGGGNQAPVLAAIGAQTVTEGQPLTVNVSASDADGPTPLLLTATNVPTGANFTDLGNGNGQLTWTPVVGDAAGSPYSVTITATEDGGAGLSDSETVSITVLPTGVGGSGALSVASALAPANVNLTTEGNADWVHWAHTVAADVDRKAGVTAQISDITAIGSTPWRSTTMPTSYSWTDGIPTPSATNSQSGLGIFAAGKGVEFTVPADTTTKTLIVYVGAVNGATGRFEASLSDNSATPYATEFYQASGAATHRVTLNFKAASAGQTLTVRYVVDRKDDPTVGSITLESASLQDGGSGISLPHFEDFASGTATGWVPVDDSGVASDWTVTNGAYRQNTAVGTFGSAMQNGYHRGTFSYLSGGETLTDYTLNLTATPLADSGQDIGVMVRHNNSTDAYTRLSFSTANGFSRLETKASGSFTTLAKNARGYPKGTPLNITMEVQGPVVIAKVNGEKLFGAYDASLTQGTVALYCRDACSFDNIDMQQNATTPEIVISEPTSYSISPSTTFNAGAVILNKPTGATVEFQVDGVPGSCSAATETDPAHFTASCSVSGQGVYQLTAILRDSGSTQLDTDTNISIGVGDNYTSVGDSITAGLDDNTAGDGVSQNGWMVSSQGYEAILTDFLATSQPQPSIVHNNGVPGDTSANVLNDRISSVLERHSNANNVILTIGVNDSSGVMFTPSGMGCLDEATCNGTFKGNLQTTIDQIVAAGKTPIISLTPPRFGDPFQAPYTDPANHTRNILIRDEYNWVISNELLNHQIGPDLYDYFLGSENRFYLYATNLHPNALGYQVMAQLIHNALTGDTTQPFVVSGLCVRLAQGGACQNPLTYKENLLETEDEYYVDQTFTLTGTIPGALSNGRWIMTADADRDAANNDVLSFDVPELSTVYVAYDDAATTLPGWLSSGFVDSGMTLSTNNTSAPTMRIYQQTNVVGNVTLGGADATTNGAAANYMVIVTKN